MITCKNISKYYWKKQALKNISINIEPWKITGIIWDNWAGKSTLMKILATSIIDYNWEILYKDKLLSDDIQELRKEIWYMPDQYWLYKDMTIHEYLKFILELNNKSYNKEKVINILKETKLGDFINHDINKLSRWMTQRVLLCQALICEPKILILDEPASWLDPKLRVLLHQLLLKFKNNWWTIIISSHILSELENLVDNIIIIKDGEVSFCDSLNNLSNLNTHDTFLHTNDNEKSKEILALIDSNITITDLEIGFLIHNSNNSNQLVSTLIQNNIEILDYNAKYKSIQNAYISVTK